MIEYMDPGPAAYKPGVCNIGPAEIARRRRIGYVSLAGVFVLGLVLLAVDAPAWSRLLVALPVAGAIEGLLQAHLQFCAGFGMSGLQNMGQLGDQFRVEDAQARAADRAKALRIHAASIAGGLMAGVAFALTGV